MQLLFWNNMSQNITNMIIDNTVPAKGRASLVQSKVHRSALSSLATTITITTTITREIHRSSSLTRLCHNQNLHHHHNRHHCQPGSVPGRPQLDSIAVSVFVIFSWVGQVSEAKIQITLLILRQGALSTLWLRLEHPCCQTNVLTGLMSSTDLTFLASSFFGDAPP